MAKPHTTNGQYTNPEVRYERSDIDLGIVLKFGVALAVLVVVTMVFLVWLFFALRKSEYASKKTDLPPASASDDRKQPEPRLEAFEDLEKRNVRLMPPRAGEYFQSQENLLTQGDPAKGVLPIQTAIKQLADKLPHRKGPDSAAPRNFHPPLPSKAAAGRIATGGK